MALWNLQSPAYYESSSALDVKNVLVSKLHKGRSCFANRVARVFMVKHSKTGKRNQLAEKIQMAIKAPIPPNSHRIIVFYFIFSNAICPAAISRTPT
jgi:hypothetical protein